MGIFRDVVRVLHIRFSLGHLLYPSHTGILVRAHIHNIIVTFILNRTAGVKGLDSIIGSYKVFARSGLVAQAPDNNTGMVHVCVYHFHISGHMSSLPFLGMRERFLTIIILMALYVTLILQINAILVTEIIPVGIVAVMRCTHMVDVSPLHQHHLLQHLLSCDSMTYSRIGLMTVHTLQLHRLSVHVEIPARQSELILTGRRVLYLNCSESEVSRCAIQETSFLILQLSHEHISVGSFCAPQSNTFQFLTRSYWLTFTFNFIGIKTDGVIVELCGKPL